MSHGYLIAQFFSPALEPARRTPTPDAAALRRARCSRRSRDGAGPELAVGVRLSADELAPEGLDAAACAEIAGELCATGLVDFASFVLGHSAYFASSSWIVPPPPAPEPSARRPARRRPRGRRRAGDRHDAASSTCAAAERLIAGGARRRGRHDARADRRSRAGRARRRSGRARRGDRLHRLQPGLHRPLPRGRADRLRGQPAHGARAHAAAARGRCGRAARARHRRRARRASPRRSRRRRTATPSRWSSSAARRSAASSGSPAARPRTASSGAAGRRPRSAGSSAPGSTCGSSTRADRGGRGRRRDVVVLATGARPVRADLGHGDAARPVPRRRRGRVDAWTAIANPAAVAGPVLVADWGGGWDGLDAAEVLAEQGLEVTLACAAPSPGWTLQQYQRNLYLARFDERGIPILHHTEVLGDRLRHLFSGREHRCPTSPRSSTPTAACPRTSSGPRWRAGPGASARATCSARARPRRRRSRASPRCTPRAPASEGTTAVLAPAPQATASSPSRWATPAASVRERTSSLARIRETCTLAVFSAM